MSKRSLPKSTETGGRRGGRALLWLAAGCGAGVLLAGGAARGQVLTIDTSGKGPVAVSGPVDRRYAQVTPTHIDLSKQELDPKTRLMLIRALQSEQGFAMRPFPRGHKGITLEANGKLEPAGEAYLNMATVNGLSAKPGDRLVITNVNIDRSKIVFDLNGGPDPKHRFLRHVQIGMGGPYDDPTMDQPIAGSANDVPTGARLTLAFPGRVPEMTSQEVENLLAPLISFNVKTPIEAFTDTLPAPLKKAILDHEVWVGMTTDMVQFAKGDPVNKYREVDDQMPVTIWMYGRPPETVEFVRVNGNRVIRVEIARVGQPLEIFTKDVVTPLMMESGKPVVEASNRRPMQEGDVQRDPNTEAPAPPPTLRGAGESLPQDSDKNSVGVMRPVYFPKDTQDDSTQLGQNPDVQPPAAPPASSKPAAATSQSAPANGSQQQTAPSSAQTAPANGQQQSTPAKPQPEQRLVAESPRAN
ncbi:MAG TPA: hypothetical protein VMA34_16875 [Terracidiphilus sp.]|nr:hypothetical protein [Terracidiphilus sp.]